METCNLKNYRVLCVRLCLYVCVCVCVCVCLCVSHAPNFQLLNKRFDFRETWYCNYTISLQCLALEFLNSVMINGERETQETGATLALLALVP